jgi:MoxR-like ATPase
MQLTPAQLTPFLTRLAEARLFLSTMIWGPPGIGKSSIVAQVAQAVGIDLIDVRLSQLAPTDLRGLPVADPDTRTSRWYPPEFLPTTGAGVLFLDEINMAPPAMQGVAQQLILDRRIGSYRVPDDWLVWAAGNRKEDRASVFDMPAPLANRFIHLTVLPDPDSFRGYALRHGLHEQVLAFLAYRPKLLHVLDPQRPAWPSPRSWVMAGELHRLGLDITPAVGEGAAADFAAFIALYRGLPDLAAIVAGALTPPFPTEPSMRYALTLGLAARAGDTPRVLHALSYLLDHAPAEWVNLFAADLFPVLRQRNQMGAVTKALVKNPRFQQFMAGYRELLGL